MLSQISELFFLQLATGVSLALLLVRSPALGKGFYILNTILALVSSLLVILFEISQPTPETTTVLTGASLSSLFLLIASALQALRNRSWSAPLLAAIFASMFALCANIRSFTPHILQFTVIEDLLRVAACFLGSMLLGASVVDMNLGHWYLISKGLTFDVLEFASRILTSLIAARFLVLGVTTAVLYYLSGSGNATLHSLWAADGHLIFFLMRILWGLLIPLVLGILILKCIQMKSNRAATGLLYVTVIALVIGELLANYLGVLTGVPV